jgi:hypothetical protein
MKMWTGLRKSCMAALTLVALVHCSDAWAKTPLWGKLKTRDNKSVSVNGNQVGTGATVASGAKIESPAGVGATVDLGKLGRVDLASQTNVTITFGEGQVTVNLQEGHVVLTTHTGVVGTLTDPSGAAARTDGAKTSSVAAGTPNAAGRGVGAGKAVAGAAAGAAAAGGAAAGRGRGRGRDLSPSTPRRN